MQQELEQMLFKLKMQNIPASKIEEDLGFSNGVLGKAVKGKPNLSKARFEMVKLYFKAYKPKEGVFFSEDEVKKLAKKIKAETSTSEIKKEEPQTENKPQEDEKIDFDGITLFNIENYTKYPLSSKPKTASEYDAWKYAKKKDDERIRKLYNEYKLKQQ